MPQHQHSHFCKYSQTFDTNTTAWRLFFPEAGRDVLEGAVVEAAVETLVGGGLGKRAEVLDKGPNLDVVEFGAPDGGG